MTRTETAPPTEQQERRRRAPSLMLVVGLPVLLVLLVAAVVVAAALLPTAFRSPVAREASVAGGSTIAVSAADARFDLGPSADGRVHVRLDGWAVGTPELVVRTAAGRTTVRAGCPRIAWFSACSLRLRIALPDQARVTLSGSNGAIGLTGLAGGVEARTTNGAITARSMSGDLVLVTTNGPVRIAAAGAQSVRASTSNGAVDVALTAVPRLVEARSTNGAVTVALPSSAAYAVTAHTTNGSVDTSAVRTDPGSSHRVVAETTNGAVRVTNAG